MLQNQYAVQCKTFLLGTLVFSCSPQTQFPFIFASRNRYQPQTSCGISHRRARSNYLPLPPSNGAGMAFSTLGKLAVHASRDAEQPWADLSSSDFYNPRPGWQLGNKLRLRKVSIAKGANNI